MGFGQEFSGIVVNMIRTRDFLLFLLTAGFLLVGIFSLVAEDIRPEWVQTASVSLGVPSALDTETVYSAAVPTPAVIANREARLTAMREQVAGAVVLPEPPAGNETSVLSQTDQEVASSAVEIVTGPQYCSDVNNFSGAWEARGLIFEVVEGVRLVYREVDVPTAILIPETESFETVITTTREVLLQLPLRTRPVSIKSCLPYDVIGLALDGSLIRNSEHGLYSIFGAETLVGYALDGFPIYGLNSDLPLDECGGTTQAGEYSYYLGSKKDNILSCFSGIPVRF